jgi:hypothetical protein
MLVKAMAQYLHDLGIVNYQPSLVTGNTFIMEVPPGPDLAITLTPSGGSEPDHQLGYDRDSFQIRTRGPRGSGEATYQKALDISNAISGLKHVTLPGGIYLLYCYAVQSTPASIGRDQNQRPEFTQNFRTEQRNTNSTHRL